LTRRRQFLNVVLSDDGFSLAVRLQGGGDVKETSADESLLSDLPVLSR
jgi:hypothetical protein